MAHREPGGPGFWTEVDTVFADAVEISRDLDARARLVAERCGDRHELRTEVEGLLAAHDAAGGFLSPAHDEETAPPSASLPPGTLVGAYRLTRLLGQGGMAEVYRAERADGLFGHAVALKVTRTALVDPEVARRFRIERQILASLQHPHIVTLLDGGTLPDGRAYLVMELVTGAPITRACRDGQLSLEARLRLFRQVCAAVQHAHRHGIVHRDLKPANILVTETGVAKVLDFGVAKLLASAPASETHTETGLVAGPLTPNYASPEQLRGLPVTTASDIYALAVLLFELVTGARPYETTGQPLDRVIDLVVRADPPRPSAWREPGAEPLPYDRRRLRGDLDSVVLKGLAKEPERRYASAEELAADVGRVLDARPVVARGPSTLYVLRRLAARHKLTAAAGLLALVAVVVSLGVAVWQRERAEHERRRSEQRFGEVRRLANTLIFDVHDAIVPLPGATPVRRTIVAEALRYLELLASESSGDTALQVELAGAYARIGRVQGGSNDANLGDVEGARASYTKALALLRPLATRPEASIDVRVAYANALIDRVFVPTTESPLPMARESLAYADRLLAEAPGVDAVQRVVARAAFATGLSLDPPESLPFLQRAVEISESQLTRRSDADQAQSDLAGTLRVLGAHRSSMGEFGSALPPLVRARELDERRLARTPLDRRAQHNLAVDLMMLAGALGHLPEPDLPRVRSVCVDALRLYEAMAAADPKNVFAQQGVGWVLAGLARVEAQLGRSAAAQALLDRAGEIERLYPMQGAVGYRLASAEAWLALGEAWRASGDVRARCRAFAKSVAEFDAAVRDGDPAVLELPHLRALREGARRGSANCR
jgi:serine/threonine protein kinase/tetratricopeptide (TPR) repeat protein